MNLDKFKKGIDDLKEVRMTLDEKQKISSSLDFYIKKTTSNIPIKSPWYSFYFVHSRVYGVALSVVLVSLVGLGTFYGAENSLPGDGLYSVKVGVIEPLQYTMTLDELSKANLETHNLDTRLREAELLQVQGKLTDSISQDIENRIKAHSESFNAVVSNLSNTSKIDDNSDVNIDWQANVDAHAKIIDSLEENQTNSKGNLNRIKDSIAAKSGEKRLKKLSPQNPQAATFSIQSASIQTAEISTSTDQIVIDDKDFESKKVDTQKIIKDTKESIEKFKNNKKINKRILQDVKNTIKDAEDSLKNAENSNNSGDKNGALNNLINSRRRAKEAATTFDVGRELDGKGGDEKGD